METIFSKIIAKEIPADIVYEDDIVLAFLDIKPTNHGHTLVVPKVYSADATETDEATLAHLITVGQKIAQAQRAVLGATGNNLIFNCGKDGGQEVFHTHLHVIPRFANDGVFEHAHRTTYAEGESAIVANKLVATIQ